MSSDHNGRGPSHRWLRTGLVLALVVLAASTSGPPASAQPGTSPTEAPPSAPPPPTAPGTAANPAARTDGEVATNPCAGGSGAATKGASIVPDECWGRFPSSHYDIGFDQGSWNDVSAKF
ncbi:MAG: hypothetical protein KY447_11930, partial [Actinobacteria bacterium]|nr:hypothetical protein [Actinomycetota bacterium]